MIEVTNITKSYNKKTILNGITFSAAKGECIGIIGANGCGKSTLLAILSGALKADSGSICYNGENAIGNSGIFLKYTGYVPQENPIIEELSVKDNLRLWYAYGGKKLKDNLKEGLPVTLGLMPVMKMPARKLSGGMKKRLSIACALCNQQPILIMDEPSSALDLICKADIHDYMKGYLHDGGTILITTHDESEFALCNRLYIISGGMLKETSSKLSVKDLVTEF